MQGTTIKDHVRGTATFQHFRDNALYYKTDTGLMFAVPVADTDKGVFLASDKSMFFMRWIRKELAGIAAEANPPEPA